MREMKDSGVEWIGETPKSWRILRNKRIMRKVKEIHSLYQGEDVLSLTMNGVVVRDLDNPYGKMPTSFDGYQYIQKGNLLMCLFDIDVTPRCVGLINNNGVTSPAYSQFRLLDENHAPYYYFYYLYLDHRKELLHLAKNLRHSFTEDQLGELHVPVPPIREQKRIADYLDSKCALIDSIIAKQDTIIEKLKEYKLSAITEAVLKGLNPDVEMKSSGVDWIGEIPTGWDTVRIKWLLNERKDRSKEGKEEPLSMSQKYGIIPTKEMERVPNLASSYIGGKIVHENDLVFNKLKAHLGVFSVSKFFGVVSPDYAVYYSTGMASLKYLEYVFKTQQCIREFRKRSSGVADGLTRLYTDGLYSIYVPFPPKEEQIHIAAHIDKIMKEIEKTISDREKVIDKLREYKKSLIYEVVTGKKEV